MMGRASKGELEHRRFAPNADARKAMDLVVSVVIDEQTCFPCKSKNGLHLFGTDQDTILHGLVNDCANVKTGGICRCVVRED